MTARLAADRAPAPSQPTGAVVVRAAVELLRRHAPKSLGPALDRAAGGLIYNADRAAIEKVVDDAPLSEAERRVVKRAWKFMGFLSGSAPEPIPEPPPALAKKIAAAKTAWDAATAEWRAAEAELDALRAQSRRELAEMAGLDDRPPAPWLEYIDAEKRWVARLQAAEQREKATRERAGQVGAVWQDFYEGWRDRVLRERAARAAGVLC